MGGPDGTFATWAALFAWLAKECGLTPADVAALSPAQVQAVYLHPRLKDGGGIDLDHGRDRPGDGLHAQWRRELFRLGITPTPALIAQCVRTNRLP